MAAQASSWQIFPSLRLGNLLLAEGCPAPVVQALVIASEIPVLGDHRFWNCIASTDKQSVSHPCSPLSVSDLVQARPAQQADHIVATATQHNMGRHQNENHKTTFEH